jgi:hypothetical protein
VRRRTFRYAWIDLVWLAAAIVLLLPLCFELARIAYEFARDVRFAP